MKKTNESQREKRKRIVVHKTPVLVRSVKPGEADVLGWERQQAAGTQGIWKQSISAA